LEFLFMEEEQPDRKISSTDKITRLQIMSFVFFISSGN
jgi:hypothetical protein